MSRPLLCLVPKGGFITTVSTLHNAELKKGRLTTIWAMGRCEICKLNRSFASYMTCFSNLGPGHRHQYSEGQHCPSQNLQYKQCYDKV